MGGYVFAGVGMWSVGEVCALLNALLVVYVCVCKNTKASGSSAALIARSAK